VIAISALARRIGMDKSHALRYVKKLGISPQKRRLKGAGQLVSTVTDEEAEKIIATRTANGHGAPEVVVDADAGWFYLVMLCPDLSSKRVKLGFAQDLDQRLTQHRCSAPTAVVADAWPARRQWESVAIELATCKDCEHVLNEVYDCENIDGMRHRLSGLFGVLSSVME
jgi:hypothetical protein